MHVKPSKCITSYLLKMNKINKNSKNKYEYKKCPIKRDRGTFILNFTAFQRYVENFHKVWETSWEKCKFYNFKNYSCAINGIFPDPSNTFSTICLTFYM